MGQLPVKIRELVNAHVDAITGSDYTETDETGEEKEYKLIDKGDWNHLLREKVGEYSWSPSWRAELDTYLDSH